MRGNRGEIQKKKRIRRRGLVGKNARGEEKKGKGKGKDGGPERIMERTKVREEKEKEERKRKKKYLKSENWKKKYDT